MLQEAGLVYAEPAVALELKTEMVHDTLLRACSLWSDELRRTYIGNEFVEGGMPLSALIGWQIEMYHYIRDFPQAVAHGARYADGELRDILTESGGGGGP